MKTVEIIGQFSADYGHTFRVVERVDGVFVRGQGGLSESEAKEVAECWKRDARLHAEAIQHGADDEPWIDADGYRSWPIRGGESELRYYADAPDGEQWVEWGAGSYPLRVS